MRALVLAILVLAAPSMAAAQAMPVCDGHDVSGASAAFEAGNQLLTEATAEARARRRDRARELAAEALTYFDRQCELGDDGGLAERAAALMLMGEPLRSAQSYDAYLREHPLVTLDARTRRRIEANLQPGIVTVDVRGRLTATLFVDDLDFGPLPRDGVVRIPYGEHRLDALAPDGSVIASTVVTLDEASPTALFSVERASATEGGRGPVRVVVGERSGGEGEGERADTAPSPRIDYAPFYAITGGVTGALLVVALTLQLIADERARTYNDFCVVEMGFIGCEAVLAEHYTVYDHATAAWVATAVAAVGLGTVLVLDLTQPAASPEAASMRCGPTLGGASCRGTF
jgi:hypothetical protein